MGCDELCMPRIEAWPCTQHWSSKCRIMHLWGARYRENNDTRTGESVESGTRNKKKLCDVLLNDNCIVRVQFCGEINEKEMIEFREKFKFFEFVYRFSTWTSIFTKRLRLSSTLFLFVVFFQSSYVRIWETICGKSNSKKEYVIQTWIVYLYSTILYSICRDSVIEMHI